MSNAAKEFIATLVGLGIVFAFGIGIGLSSGRQTMRQEAIHYRLGEYRVTNTNTGEATFFWLTNRVDNAQ